jgi:hypothetical protein
MLKNHFVTTHKMEIQTNQPLAQPPLLLTEPLR